jgi:hypothetical protein
MRKKLPTFGFTLLFAALVTCNVLLIRQNLQMRRALEQYHPARLEAG